MDINIPVDIRSELPPKAVDGIISNSFDAFRTRVFRSDFYGQYSSELGDIWTAARKVQADTRSYFSRTRAFWRNVSQYCWLEERTQSAGLAQAHDWCAS
ncbi:Alcohol acetyltransferase [Exserohilum turcicum]